MRLLESLAVAFFNVFGITQPTASARRRASWFLAALLLLALALVCCVGWLFFRLMHRA